MIEDWSEHKTRSLISNFTWTDEATSDWADVWDALWQLGFQWEWKNGDGYVRRSGESTFNHYFVHDLYLTPPQEGSIPIPQIHVLNEIKDILLDDTRDDPRIHYAIKAINDWFKHVLFRPREDIK